jgi:hypothetical protein
MPREKGRWYADRPTSAQLRDFNIAADEAGRILSENARRYCGRFWFEWLHSEIGITPRTFCAIGVYNEGTQAYYDGQLGERGLKYAINVQWFAVYGEVKVSP